MVEFPLADTALRQRGQTRPRRRNWAAKAEESKTEVTKAGKGALNSECRLAHVAGGPLRDLKTPDGARTLTRPR